MWLETKSPHFTVVSNAGQKTGESVALQFERVRSMFKKQWAWARVDGAEPTVILAVRDERTMRSLRPSYWERRQGVRPSGLYVANPDRHSLIVRTDAGADENPYEVLYHEYTHRLLALNFTWLPLWLSYRKANDYLDHTERQMRTRPLPPAESAAVRGDFLARTGHIAEARALLDEAGKLDPSLPEPYETLAALSLRERTLDEARANAEKAIARLTTNFFTWYLSGFLSTEDRQCKEKAEASLRRSLELNPDFRTHHGGAVRASGHGRGAARGERAPRAPGAGAGPHEPAAPAPRRRDAREDRSDGGRRRACGPDRAPVTSRTPQGGRAQALASALPKDPAKRLAFHVKGCEEGKAADCRLAGERLAEGTGTARDDPRSVVLFRKACDGQDYEGCAWLGWQYERGRGIAKDEARAAEIYENACKETPWACAQLGLLYFEGRGVAKDVAKSEP